MFLAVPPLFFDVDDDMHIVAASYSHWAYGALAESHEGAHAGRRENCCR